MVEPISRNLGEKKSHLPTMMLQKKRKEKNSPREFLDSLLLLESAG